MTRAPMPMMPTGVPSAPRHTSSELSHDATCAPRVLVVLPTYRELAALPFVIEHVLAAVPHAHVLVIDDESPDGTGVWAEERTRNEPQLSVLHRAHRLGAASAFQQGIAWGLASGFDVVCTMAGGDRRAASRLPELLAPLAEGADVVVARRIDEVRASHIRAGRDRIGAGLHRAPSRRLVDQPLGDSTSCLRVYRARLLARLDVASVRGTGAGFHVELLWRAARAGARLVECPVPVSPGLHGPWARCRAALLAAATLVRLRQQDWRPRTSASSVGVSP